MGDRRDWLASTKIEVGFASKAAARDFLLSPKHDEMIRRAVSYLERIGFDSVAISGSVRERRSGD
jgi:hypothetical protein